MQEKNQLKGYKFRRQHPIGAFILDFYLKDFNIKSR
ncbi:MAG: hypothetical protein RLZZ292_515 [Bacteroidota bacterium]|jgi:very-short-patch-repair endonuclease